MCGSRERGRGQSRDSDPVDAAVDADPKASFGAQGGLNNRDIFGFNAFFTFDYVKFNLFTRCEPWATFAHRTKVDENFFAIVAADKTKTLATIKPFHFACLSSGVTFWRRGFVAGLSIVVVCRRFWAIYQC